MKLLFYFSLITIVYTYIVYPALVYLLSLVFERRVKKSGIYPSISILISVYNEEKNIEQKIKSILELDYPPGKIEVLIGSDGSTDKTDSIVMQYIPGPQVTKSQCHQDVSENIKLFRQQLREGKPAVLNSLVEHAKNEILVFTDARQKLERSSLKELVGNFGDNSIGSVSAQLVFEDDTGNRGIGAYWNYEKFIRISESKIGSMLGATGAMYAIRKNLFSKLPNDLILDDVFIPLKIVSSGFRAIFEPKAIIFDSITRDAGQEFQRKSRTLAGNFQIFGLFKGLFNPVKSPVAIQLFSHKFLRLLVPFLMIIIFVANITMLDKNFYLLIFAFQVLFYFVAFLGSMLKKSNKIFDIPHMFCVMNSAAIVGLYRFLFNKQTVTWEKSR